MSRAKTRGGGLGFEGEVEKLAMWANIKMAGSGNDGEWRMGAGGGVVLRERNGCSE